MIDRAAILFENGYTIAADRVSGSNDNMTYSHFHTYYELYYLEEGCRSHMLEGVRYETAPGDFMIFPPFSMHHSFTEGSESFKRIVLYFTPEMIDSSLLSEKLLQAGGLYHPSLPYSKMVHSLLNQILLLQNSPDRLNGDFIRATLNYLLFILYTSISKEEVPETPSRISKIIQYIDLHTGEEIRLKDLADRFFISEFYLSHEFKKQTGRTVVGYINYTRIIKAQHLIQETNMNFTQIAAQCGYASLTHFNRTFRKITGMSPTAFRRSRRRAGNGYGAR